MLRQVLSKWKGGQRLVVAHDLKRGGEGQQQQQQKNEREDIRVEEARIQKEGTTYEAGAF